MVHYAAAATAASGFAAERPAGKMSIDSCGRRDAGGPVSRNVLTPEINRPPVIRYRCSRHEIFLPRNKLTPTGSDNLQIVQLLLVVTPH